MLQLTHDVSAAGANSFWKLAMTSIPSLINAREKFEIGKHVPGFIHQRRQMYKEYCPDIHMKFVYYNKNTHDIETFEGSTCPRKRFPKIKYIKLYEEAHIKVYECYTALKISAILLPLKIVIYCYQFKRVLYCSV